MHGSSHVTHRREIELENGNHSLASDGRNKICAFGDPDIAQNSARLVLKPQSKHDELFLKTHFKVIYV